MQYELGIIEQMGFADYFLVVADFIAWAKTNGVPVGPGRGSGAGSLVAYAIGITDLDPLSYDLLFERFLNPERVSLPDFDVDFCMLGRDRVIDYVTQKYGREKVGQIITYSTMAARAVVRDVTRVLGLPYIVGDRISKMIPGAPAFAQEAADAGRSTLEHALAEVPELAQLHAADEETREIISRSFALEGVTRGVGVHAGGVVIAPNPLTDYAPLFCEPGGEGVRTQFDMKDLETAGLLKFDFLGLKTLTIIRAAVELISGRTGAPPIDPLQLPLDDKLAYELYASGRTSAVFQMESGGMQRASVDLKPDRFEDLIALISLFRPGPMELIPSYVARKHGRERTEYLHPAMKELLEPTFGIFVYQEQVMQIAQKLAGYTLGGADLLRRAMGKKKPAEMAKQRMVFVEGCRKNAIAAATAMELFDLIEKFAGYGFNKSHAAAYALVSYQTAWLKAHHPAEFMAAVLSCDMDHTDTVVMMLDECRRMGLKLVKPDINRSDYRFIVAGDREIIYGLGAIRGMGAAALEGILAERARNGPFTDLENFCRRIDTRKANKRVLEALIFSGALDGLGNNRPTLLKNLPMVLQKCEKEAGDSDAGQSSLFGGGLSVPAPMMSHPQEADWSDNERLMHEKNVLGLYLSGHPIEAFRPMIDQLAAGRLKALIDQQGTTPNSGNGEMRFARRGPQILIGAWLTDVRRFGRRATLTLDDRTAQVMVPLNEEFIGALRQLPKPDQLLFVSGRLAPDNFTGGWQIYPRELLSLEEAQQRYADLVLLKWPAEKKLDLESLMTAMTQLRDPKGCRVSLRYLNGTAEATLDFGAEWRVRALESGLTPLRRLIGEGNVKVSYRRPVVSTPEVSYASE